MSREAIACWFFAIVVVRRGDRFLFVHERKHRQTWYLPGGRVEPGETLAEAAVRETLEETGVPVVLDGVLRVEHSPGPPTRVRAFFHAHASEDAAPKSTPDEHSLAARWVTLDELRALPQRGAEALAIVAAVLEGAPVYPLEIVCAEGALWPGPSRR
jgi:8-oxo-dGTP pyrophosphatase MutT (NUDIX family)